MNTSKQFKKQSVKQSESKNNDILIENILEYSPDKFYIDKVQPQRIPNSNMTYLRAFIKVNHPDGTHGNVYINLPNYYTFGVSADTSMQDDSIVTGYSMGVVLTDREGATEEQQNYLNKLNEIIEHLRQDLVSKQIHKYKTVDKDKFSCISIKRDSKGEIVDNSSYVLKCKLKYDKKNSRILSRFTKKSGVYISNPKSLKSFKFDGVLSLESIYMGSSGIKMQAFLTEVKVHDKEERVTSFFSSKTDDVVYEEDGEEGEYEEKEEKEEKEDGKVDPSQFSSGFNTLAQAVAHAGEQKETEKTEEYNEENDADETGSLKDDVTYPPLQLPTSKPVNPKPAKLVKQPAKPLAKPVRKTANPTKLTQAS